MNILLVTTFYGKQAEIANIRIQEEAEKMGHTLVFHNSRKISFSLENNVLHFPLLEKKYDLVIIRGTFRNRRIVRQLVDMLRKKGIRVFDNGFAKHGYLIDKQIDTLRLADKNIPMPKTYQPEKFSLYTNVAKQIGYPIVVKHTQETKGRGVKKYDSKQELETFIAQTTKKTNAQHYLLQEFIDYEYDLRLYVIGNNVFAMRRTPPEGDFRANFSRGGSVETYVPHKKLSALAIRAARALDLGIAGVDMLIDKDNNPFIIEVNHTPGLVGIEKATGVNIAQKYLEFALQNAL